MRLVSYISAYLQRALIEYILSKINVIRLKYRWVNPIKRFDEDKKKIK